MCPLILSLGLVLLDNACWLLLLCMKTLGLGGGGVNTTVHENGGRCKQCHLKANPHPPTPSGCFWQLP